MMPCFRSSPQFFSLAISKSNRLLAVNCVTDAICASAASLHLRCIPLFNGIESVAESPRLKLWFALMSVRTGLNHDGVISPPASTTSGTPLGLSISWIIVMSDPSGNHLTVAPLSSVYVLSSYHSSQG